METNNTQIRYQVIDSRTGSVMGTKDSLRKAARMADRLDNQYGAVRYIVRRASL